jgi:hypothetical protein
MSRLTCAPYPNPSPASGSQCTFNFGAPTYLQFDLTALASTYTQCTLSGAQYRLWVWAFSLCSNLPASVTSKCPERNPAVQSAQLAQSDVSCFRAYGMAPNVSASVLENGLALTYSAGQCSASLGDEHYYTTLSLTCAPELAPGVVLVDSLTPPDGTSCGLLYTGRSAAACGRVVPILVRPLGITASILLGLGALLVAYFVGGALWNRRYRGSRGLEAVPHIAFFRWAVEKITCGKLCSQPEAARYDELSANDDTAYFTARGEL